jgi:hypothetical protein
LVRCDQFNLALGFTMHDSEAGSSFLVLAVVSFRRAMRPGAIGYDNTPSYAECGFEPARHGEDAHTRQ